MSEQQNMNLNVDLKSTTAIEGEDGNHIFQEEDAVMPIPVFFDTVSGKVLESTIPVDLRDEYKEISI